MKCNMGKKDRVIRVVVGLVIFLVGFMTHSWWGLIGFLPIATAAVGHCPAYCPLGIDTSKGDAPKEAAK